MQAGGRIQILDFEFYVLFKGPYLVKLDLEGKPPSVPVAEAPKASLEAVKKALKCYFFEGAPYADLPILLLEVPPFTQRCLGLLRQIPRGQTRTYQWLAKTLGAPKALRAVGQALARNPLPLFFPCHRVVGKKGWGGFSAGLEWKKRLLSWEGVKV